MITIEQTESSPYISVDTENKKVVLNGNSFALNPHQVFAKLADWAKSYSLKNDEILTVQSTMGYYSTSNIQFFNLIFKTLSQNNPGKIDLTFYVDAEDEEDMEETMFSLLFNTGLPLKKNYL